MVFHWESQPYKQTNSVPKSSCHHQANSLWEIILWNTNGCSYANHWNNTHRFSCEIPPPPPPTNSMMTSWNGNIFRVTGYWPFVRGIHRPPVNSPHKGQRRGALMFSLICARINGLVNNREAGDLRRHRVHYHAICNIIAASQLTHLHTTLTPILMLLCFHFEYFFAL